MVHVKTGICPEVFMQIVQHERGLCVKSFHVFWQTCVFPDFSDWSPPLTVTRAQAKENSSCCHEDYVCGEFTSCSCSLGFCLKKKKKKKKKTKQKSNFHSDLWEKQIRNGIHASIYGKAAKVHMPHGAWVAIFLSGNIFSILAWIYVSYLKNWHEGKDTRKAKGPGHP